LKACTVPELTASQLDAVEYRAQDACVVAGPGSGKTTVLVERYRALVEERGFEPRNILAITFTEKAAANMKSKLAELFAHDPPRLRDVEAGYVHTIHGFCARLLRENAIAAGIDPRFSVMDARVSEDLQYSCINSAFDELVEHRRTEALQLIEALQEPDLAGDLKNAYDGIRSAGKTIAEVRAMENPGHSVSPRETSARLRELLANWPQSLTPARRTQRSALLEWAQKLAEADGNPGIDLIGVTKEFSLHLVRVPAAEKEVLEE
jgi:ATP-dependent helicase/nuclease subunit A